MEEENSCPSLLTLTDSVLQMAQQDTWTPLELQHVSENQQADMWAETEIAVEQVREMCQLRESQTEAGDSPEETEQWEQIMWPMRSLSCTNTTLSFATVEWDVPSLHVTDCSVASQLGVGSPSFVDAASLSLHHFQDVEDELLAAERREEDEEEEEKNWINSPLLDSIFKETAKDPEPCDAVDEQGPQTQEGEDSTHVLLDALTEVLPAVDAETQDEYAADLAESVGSVDFADILEDEDEVLSFVHLKLEEERVEPDVLLTGQEHLEDELLLPPLSPPPSHPVGPETEEEKDQQKRKAKEEVKDYKVKVEKEEKEHKEQEVKKNPLKKERGEKQEHKGEEVNKDQLEKEAHKEEEVKEEKEEKQVHIEEELKEDRVNLDQVKEEDIEEVKVEAEGKAEEDLEEDKVKKEENEVEAIKRNENVEEVKVKEKADVEKEEEEDGLKAKVQEEDDEKVEVTKVEEQHEERDAHSAAVLVSENVAVVADVQPAELSEERRRSARDKDAEVPVERHVGLGKELEMCKDADLKTDSVKPSFDHPTFTDTLKVAETKDQEASCLQQQEVMEQLPPSDKLQQQEVVEKLPPSFDELQQPAEDRLSGELSGQIQHLEPSSLTEEAEEEVHTEAEERAEGADWPLLERAICAEAELPTASERREQTEPAERKVQTASELQPAVQQETDESEVMQQQLPPAVAATEHRAALVDEGHEVELQSELVTGGSEAVSPHAALANGKKPQGPEMAAPHANGAEMDQGSARRLAERLFNLDGIQRVDVVKHVDKDNDFSRAVGEEYLKFFDFTGQTLDRALRSFLQVVVLIGETQERERVLQHFSCRFHQCNPESFPSHGSILALTCALMLLNTDLHGQNVGKSMSSSKFVSNLDGMNEGENFGKDLLKSLYNSIKSEPLQWAIDERELVTSMLVDEGPAVVLRSKTNPFQDVPHDKKAVKVKEGLLQRKIHADVDGKRTPWGKRGWKTFNGVLRGMVLYLQKVDYRSDQQVTEEVISVHHSLAERAADYTKKPYVFRLQTADWRVFLIQATCKTEMYSWISRINLISALHSSPPFPAAVGSQRRFSRPILPSSQSAHTLERQLQSYSGMLESFRIDLSHLQSNPPEGKKAKAKEVEEHRTRAEYLHHEVCRYETYVQVLGAWKSVKKMDANRLNEADLCLFDKAACVDHVEGDEEEDEDLRRSHSSPALEVEEVPSSVIKVKRNISERRTYRKPIIPRSSKDS